MNIRLFSFLIFLVVAVSSTPYHPEKHANFNGRQRHTANFQTQKFPDIIRNKRHPNNEEWRHGVDDAVDNIRTGVKTAVKGVKSRIPNTNFNQYFGFGNNQTSNRNLTGSSQVFNNGTRDLEKGVCYVEVPTITLVKNPNNVPPGNGSDPTMSKIRKCCPGYQRNPHNFRICEPVCEHECVNAKCVAPNICSCYTDHVVDLDGWCVPTCPIGCLNGECSTHNECICKSGYVLEPKMKFCMPKCSRGCLHGNCTAPDVCTCESGYEYDGEGICKPKCDLGCGNGDCVAPNQCVCHFGYSENINGTCDPVCSSGCPQGKCIAPETCSCGDGFTLDKDLNKCVAHCEKPCLNGDCTGPNECTCRAGFGKDPRDPGGFRCIGMCPGGCPNGVCSGPNLCLCLPGYVKDRSVKGSQRCIPRAKRSINEHHLKYMFE